MGRTLSLTWPRVLAWRAHRSHLGVPADTGIVEVARRLVGVQAQVMSSAELALCLRTRSATPGDVQDALWRQRSLVKTWTARGTLHLVPPDDLPVWFAAMQARGPYWAKPSWERYHDVSAAEMKLVLEGMDEALEDACLTRTELARRLGRVTKRPDLATRIMSSWGGVIKPAAYTGRLCFGPNRGRNVTFVSPRDWIGPWRDVDADAALAQLARRYVDTYGPSSRDDFVRWLGVEARIGRRGFQAIEAELVPVDVDETAAFLTEAAAEDATRRRRRRRRAVRLLPAFDPYVVGVLSHLERLLPDPSLRPRVSRTAGWISPTITVDGAVMGVWRHERRRQGVEIALEEFVELGRPDPALAGDMRAALGREILKTAELMHRLPDDGASDSDDAAGEAN